MAQLIKLQDFISRYETDIFRYPSQYIRLKKERWEKVKTAWHSGETLKQKAPVFRTNHTKFEPFDGFESFDENWLEQDKKSVLQTIKGWFNKSNNDNDEELFEESFYEATSYIVDKKKTEQELKLEFLDELFYFQLNWASSTLRDRSFLDGHLYKDDVLKFFLQHFPDNYLVLYQPTMIVRKAPIELDIILISPFKTYCISLLESDGMSVYRTDRGRYWFEGSGEDEKKRLNPMIALNRSARLIESYYKHYEVDMPVKKIVLSRTGYFEGSYEPLNTDFIDKRNYSEWYTKFRRMRSPIKYIQLKGAQSLLRHCRSTYVRRNEWEPDIEQFDDEGLDDFNK